MRRTHIILLAAGLLGSSSAMADEWSSMKTAPKDGTVIEIKNTSGVMPWYDIAKWSNELQKPGRYSSDGSTWRDEPNGIFSWESVARASHLQSCDKPNTCWWRPYHGPLTHYDDPTHGLQFTTGYWANH